MTNREGDRLPHWIADVCADDQYGLAGFATGLLPNLDAVIYGMSTHWSSGPVEGRVNDLKRSSAACSAERNHPYCANDSS
ncbi:MULTISPECIES: hypothetical protein [unclassified Kitasatospora]|uniref:hypothetical protein n=1 Tax=unclassified Kitasatospora TaxID=2633591 RepID=UPI0033FCCE90